MCPPPPAQVVTGSSDGLLRLISIQPNKLLGVVGEHSDFPVETVVLSHDRKVGACAGCRARARALSNTRACQYLVSASHDNKVKFWNIEYLFEEDDGEEAPMDVVPAQADGGGEKVRGLVGLLTRTRRRIVIRLR